MPSELYTKTLDMPNSSSTTMIAQLDVTNRYRSAIASAHLTLISYDIKDDKPVNGMQEMLHMILRPDTVRDLVKLMITAGLVPDPVEFARMKSELELVESTRGI